MSTSELDQILQQAKRDGWTIDLTIKGRYRLTHPRADRPILTGITTRNPRALLNFKADLKRSLKPEHVEIPDLRDEMKTMAARAIKAENALVDTIACLTTMTTRAEAAETMLAEANAILAVMKTRTADDETALAASETRISKLEASLATMTTRASNAKAALADTEATVAALTRRLATTVTALDEAKAKIRTMATNMLNASQPEPAPAPPTEIAALGSRLRERRNKLGLSQAAAAAVVGVHQVIWSQWERNITRPEPWRMKFVARALRTQASRLAAAAA